MAKKVVFCILFVLSLLTFSNVYAQSGGNVYLDLKEDEDFEDDTSDFFETFIRMGKNYIDDVVEYDDRSLI